MTVCLAAVLSLGGLGGGCMRCAAPPAQLPTDLRPLTSDLRSSAPAADAPAAKPAVTHAKAAPPKTAQKAAARQVPALVRKADDAVRATPAGAQAWARVEAAQTAYETALRRDETYRNLAAQQARLDAAGPTNALENPMAVSHALSGREDVLLRDRPDVAQARAACEQARREYGSLVREDPRFAEAAGMMSAMKTNGLAPKAP
jgi:hypothetical protein